MLLSHTLTKREKNVAFGWIMPSGLGGDSAMDNVRMMESQTDRPMEK